MLALWTWQLIVAMALNCVMQAFQIAAYAARVAGVKTGQVATAISLFSRVWLRKGRVDIALRKPFR